MILARDYIPNNASGGIGWYIDHVIFRDRDINSGWTSAADGTLEERMYYCQNWRADVSAILTSSSKMVEWIKYSAYGTPTALPTGDTDSDGDFDLTDLGNMGGGYEIRKDAELDGDVDANDINYAIANGYQTLGRGVLTSSYVGNRKGYAGYENDGTIVRFAHVRYRVLDSTLGRWTRRDPLGYVDGMGLYEYGASRPIYNIDASGMLAQQGGGLCRPQTCTSLGIVQESIQVTWTDETWSAGCKQCSDQIVANAAALREAFARLVGRPCVTDLMMGRTSVCQAECECIDLDFSGPSGALSCNGEACVSADEIGILNCPDCRICALVTVELRWRELKGTCVPRRDLSSATPTTWIVGCRNHCGSLRM